jgi:hypothetical protein
MNSDWEIVQPNQAQAMFGQQVQPIRGVSLWAPEAPCAAITSTATHLPLGLVSSLRVSTARRATCNSVSISALPCSRELLAARFVPETSSVSPRRCVRGEERVIVGRGRRVRCVLPQAGDRQDVVGLVYLCGFAVNVVAQCVEQK